MHIKWTLFITIILIACQTQPPIHNVGKVAIIPQPMFMELGASYFEINPSTQLIFIGKESIIQPIATYFTEILQKSLGMELNIDKSESSNQENSILVELIGDGTDGEAYELNVTSKGITIQSESPAGIFYGIQTFRQLMPAKQTASSDKLTLIIPSVIIKDQPRFSWRGYMLDVSRHFFGKKDITRVLDFMAEMKLNRFHWHLSDDQGWRLEIKKFPKLTEVGAWRVDYNTTDENVSNWWGRPVQRPGDQATYGGFYAQEDIAEIVAYAKDRFIEIVPEIDMPGHSQATIAAYPEISCTSGPFYVATGGVYKDNTFCPGKEITFEFVEEVLNEVMDMFPYEYIHIGGDECNKSAWKTDPDCQRRMAEEHLKDEHELQSYFIKRVEKIINARGRNMIGWDEILEGGLAPNATVMSWRGEKGGIAAAKAGHDVIMTPNKYCYLDLKQGHDDLEPNLGYSYSFLKDAYHFNIISDSLTEKQGKHVLGVQGNLWTESISDWSKLTYMTFPRLFAIAENAWTSESAKNWRSFAERLIPQFHRLNLRGERYATSAFNVWIDHQAKDKSIEISLKTEIDNLDIFYTLDGSEPTQSAHKYDTSFLIKESSTFTATSFWNGKQIGNFSKMYFPIHQGVHAKVVYQTPYSEKYPAGGVSALVDLNYAKLHRNDAAWQGIDGDIEVDLVFDDPKSVKKIELTTLRMTIGGIYPPEIVEIYGSENGKTFVKLAELEQLNKSHTQGRNKITSEISFQQITVKSIKIKAKSVNPIPQGHHLAGSSSWIFIDEVVVY